MDIFENNIEDLEHLEDKDIEIREKKRKNHNVEKDDVFYRAKLPYNNHSIVCKSKNSKIKNKDKVVVHTTYGNEIVFIQGRVTNMDDILTQDEIVPINRIAGEKDLKKFNDNIKKSEKAYSIAQKKIKSHKLEMKLVSVHYFLEDPKILFNFTADGRVDFRDLVKDLAGVFKTRIELRQIGVRDECRILHGYGQCGRHFCCSDVCNELEPITIKMAKEQNITLNSLKISGACGRLLCCLSHEYNTYLEEKKAFPPEGATVRFNHNNYIIEKVNIQTGSLKIFSEDNGILYIDSKDLKYNNSKKIYYYNEPETTKRV